MMSKTRTLPRDILRIESLEATLLCYRALIDIVCVYPIFQSAKALETGSSETAHASGASVTLC